MERMTDAEKKQLNELQAKQKRVQRAEAAFLRDADERKEELLRRWGVTDRLSEAATLIGTDPDALYEWIVRDDQVRYYRQHHQSASADPERSNLRLGVSDE